MIEQLKDIEDISCRVIGRTGDRSIQDIFQDLISVNFHKIERERTDHALARSETFAGGMAMSILMSISDDLPHSLSFSPLRILQPVAAKWPCY
jgi:hypothetical protein